MLWLVKCVEVITFSDSLRGPSSYSLRCGIERNSENNNNKREPVRAPGFSSSMLLWVYSAALEKCLLRVRYAATLKLNARHLG